MMIVTALFFMCIFGLRRPKKAIKYFCVNIDTTLPINKYYYKITAGARVLSLSLSFFTGFFKDRIEIKNGKGKKRTGRENVSALFFFSFFPPLFLFVFFDP